MKNVQITSQPGNPHVVKIQWHNYEVVGVGTTERGAMIEAIEALAALIIKVSRRRGATAASRHAMIQSVFGAPIEKVRGKAGVSLTSDRFGRVYVPVMRPKVRTVYDEKEQRVRKLLAINPVTLPNYEAEIWLYDIETLSE